MTWHGQGASVLMLQPSVQFRSSEMWPLQQRLGSWFTTLAIDWVSFGGRPRPPLRWSPEIYEPSGVSTERNCASAICDNRRWTCRSVLSGAAAARPGSTGRFMLIALTWRGPLPTMMGRKHPMFCPDLPHSDWPGWRPSLSLTPIVSCPNALGHVYANSSSLSEARFEEKMAVTRASGARHILRSALLPGNLTRWRHERRSSLQRRRSTVQSWSCTGPRRRRDPARRCERWRVCPMLWLLLSPMQNWPCMRNSPTK